MNSGIYQWIPIDFLFTSQLHVPKYVQNSALSMLIFAFMYNLKIIILENVLLKNTVKKG